MTPKEIFSTEQYDGKSSVRSWIKQLSEKYGKSFKHLEGAYYRFYKHKALAEEVEKVGIPIENVGHYWHKGQHFSIFTKTDKDPSYFDIRDEIVESMKSAAPSYTVPVLQSQSDPHLLVVDPADIHIGKLARAIETGEEYNTKIAVDRVLEGLSGLLNKASGFNIDRVLLVIGNDILHTDNHSRSTTKGTPQDTDGMWYDNFRTAKDLYIKVIETLMYVSPVNIMYNPSNHDFVNGFFLADTLSSWFSNVHSVKFDVSPSHRKYYVYGKNLIGGTHGDGAKEADLPLLMANEASEFWHDCPHRYFYTHHIHHKRSREIGSVTIESLRSPSGADSYHHRYGYQHNAKAVEAFIHHPKFGQVARLTHIFS